MLCSIKLIRRELNLFLKFKVYFFLSIYRIKLRVLAHLFLKHMQAFSDCLWKGFLMLMYCDLLAKNWFLNYNHMLMLATLRYSKSESQSVICRKNHLTNQSKGPLINDLSTFFLTFWHSLPPSWHFLRLLIDKVEVKLAFNPKLYLLNRGKSCLLTYLDWKHHEATLPCLFDKAH